MSLAPRLIHWRGPKWAFAETDLVGRVCLEDFIHSEKNREGEILSN